jgi:hypothetical protein
MHDADRDAVATVAALHAARRSGVLDALLDDADTPADVADATTLDEHAADVLVDVLADRGFFEHVDGAYEPTNRALGLLTKTDLRSIGTTPHEIDRFACYAALPETLDADTDDRGANRPEGFERNRLGAVQATPDATVSAAVSAAVRAVPAPTTVLDLGGAPGPYATEFAARGHDVVLRDDADATAAARPLLEPRDVTLDPGPLTSDLPTADLAFASDLTPRLDDEDLDRALAAAHDALTRAPETTPDTTERALVAIEHVRDHSPHASTRRLEALATGDPGDCRTEPDLRDRLANAGFDRVERRAVPGLDRYAIVASPRRT